MKTKLVIKTLGLPAVLLVWLAGCSVPQPTANKPAVAQPPTAPENFQEPSSRPTNAVQSAIELSQKVAELSEQIATLKEEKLALTTENNQLKTQVSDLEPKLQQAQKELAEANDLLMEMRLELNNWQANVLGFQSEMREADQAQLEALLKILQLLGGEIVADTATTDDPNTSTVSDPNE